MAKDDPKPSRTAARKEAYSRWDDEGGATTTGPQETLAAGAGPIQRRVSELESEPGAVPVHPSAAS